MRGPGLKHGALSVLNSVGPKWRSTPLASKITRADVSAHTDPFLSTKEICQEYGISRQSIYDWIARGLLPKGERIGVRAVRWRRSTLDEARSRLNAGRNTQIGGEI
ncbi:helix-turn-helix transcriptional regulator [Neorhizobium galegae]|uniref:helix-turn-helix transcriptional regulator n=1 Tax=Neorhizobium galegae TaxID=399 RepID=UPI00358EBCAF